MMNLRTMTYVFNKRMQINGKYCKNKGWDIDDLTNEQAKEVRECQEYKDLLKKLRKGY